MELGVELELDNIIKSLPRQRVESNFSIRKTLYISMIIILILIILPLIFNEGMECHKNS